MRLREDDEGQVCDSASLSASFILQEEAHIQEEKNVQEEKQLRGSREMAQEERQMFKNF